MGAFFSTACRRIALRRTSPPSAISSTGNNSCLTADGSLPQSRFREGWRHIRHEHEKGWESRITGPDCVPSQRPFANTGCTSANNDMMQAHAKHRELNRMSSRTNGNSIAVPTVYLASFPGGEHGECVQGSAAGDSADEEVGSVHGR